MTWNVLNLLLCFAIGFLELITVTFDVLEQLKSSEICFYNKLLTANCLSVAIDALTALIFFSKGLKHPLNWILASDDSHWITKPIQALIWTSSTFNFPVGMMLLCQSCFHIERLAEMKEYYDLYDDKMILLICKFLASLTMSTNYLCEGWEMFSGFRSKIRTIMRNSFGVFINRNPSPPTTDSSSNELETIACQ